MSYTSPFDALVGDDPLFTQTLHYRGTLERVLSDLTTLSPTTHSKEWALHPPRILRAIVDYKVDNFTSLEVEILLRDAIEASLQIYSDPDNIPELVEGLRGEIHSLKLDDLLIKPLYQQDDVRTGFSSHPSFSQRTAQQIARKTPNTDLLFIALAHGGVAAGMDVYLRYCALSGSENSSFYVARISTQKYRDDQPQLSPTEIDYLKEQGEGKQVVIFDEDRSSGTTMNLAYTYFSANAFPFQNMIAITNSTNRDELKELEQSDMSITKYICSLLKKLLNPGKEYST